jgi:hypothetical protein
VRDQEWDSAAAELNALDLAELVLGLLGLDTVHGEAALGVVDEAEVLASLLDGDDVHEASGVGHIGADLAIHLDQTLHHNGLRLAVVKRILEAVADEDDERHAVAEFVRTGRGLGRIGAGQLVQQPVRWRRKTLLVLLAVKKKLVSLNLGKTTSPKRGRGSSTAEGCFALALPQVTILINAELENAVTHIPRAILTTGC